MTIDEVVLELYRMAETRAWDGKKSDEALAIAIEGIEQILMLRKEDMRRSARTSASRKQPRVWS